MGAGTKDVLPETPSVGGDHRPVLAFDGFAARLLPAQARHVSCGTGAGRSAFFLSGFRSSCADAMAGALAARDSRCLCVHFRRFSGGVDWKRQALPSIVGAGDLVFTSLLDQLLRH